MWVAREQKGDLYFFTEKPSRITSYGTWIWGNQDKCFKIDSSLFSNLKWEDEPIEVMIESLEELRKGQVELKNVYHELIGYKTKKIESLTRVFRGIALEEVANIITDVEDNIYRKYKMIGNPYCKQNYRMVTISNSASQVSDDSLREYIVNDKVMVTIHVRRNDFNNADILISDFGDEY